MVLNGIISLITIETEKKHSFSHMASPDWMNKYEMISLLLREAENGPNRRTIFFFGVQTLVSFCSLRYF